jgi:membrane protease YdiL (CAAX protease family)
MRLQPVDGYAVSYGWGGYLAAAALSSALLSLLQKGLLLCGIPLTMATALWLSLFGHALQQGIFIAGIGAALPSYLPLGRLSWKEIRICLPFLLQLIVLQFLLCSLYEHYGEGKMPSQSAGLLVASAKGHPVLLCAFFGLYGFVVPFSEEILFRALLLPYLEQKLNMGLAIVGASLLFGAAHLFSAHSGDVLIFAMTTGVGAACGVLFAKYRRLWPCIALHSTFNVFNLLALMGKS